MKPTLRAISVLALSLLVLSCSKTYVTKVNHIQARPVTEHYVGLGKAAYKSCKFAKALEYFSHALSGDLTNEQQAECYTFMAASFYYEGDVPTAGAYLRKARLASPSYRPSFDDFPAEIRDLAN